VRGKRVGKQRAAKASRISEELLEREKGVPHTLEEASKALSEK